MSLQACHCCGLIHRVPALEPGQSTRCSRCRSWLRRPGQTRLNAGRTAAAALGAFFLFWPAILLPILEIDQLGHHSESSILTGTIELYSHGEWFVASVVLVFSIVFPLTKLCLLIELSFLKLFHKKHKAIIYRAMEHVGKWSMMDVLLLAFMVMLVKLGDLITFTFGPAVIAFSFCVAMSMVAAMFFDPHEVWNELDESSD